MAAVSVLNAVFNCDKEFVLPSGLRVGRRHLSFHISLVLVI
jgi:hypothetical protein